MLLKVYTCPKCKKRFSYPQYGDMKEAEFNFYQIGVVCPHCKYSEYFTYFRPEYINVEDNIKNDDKGVV